MRSEISFSLIIGGLKINHAIIWIVKAHNSKKKSHYQFVTKQIFLKAKSHLY